MPYPHERIMRKTYAVSVSGNPTCAILSDVVALHSEIVIALMQLPPNG